MVDDTNPEIDDITNDVKLRLESLAQTATADKMSEQLLLMQSSSAGGPSSLAEAFDNELHRYSIGMRELAAATGIRRKVVLGMIEGRVALTPEAIVKISEVIDRKKSGHVLSRK